MKHYLMLPQDTIRVLPPEGDDPACIELVCERTLMLFRTDALKNVTQFTGVLVDKTREQALGFTGPDALFGVDYLVLLPQSHPARAAFTEALRPFVPPIETAPYRPLTCDQNGHHHD